MLVRYIITQASVWKRPLQPHRKSHRSPKMVKVTLINQMFFIIIYFHSEGCSLNIEAHRPAVKRRLKSSGRTHPTRGDHHLIDSIFEEHHLMLTVFAKKIWWPLTCRPNIYFIMSSIRHILGIDSIFEEHPRGDHRLERRVFTKCVSSYHLLSSYHDGVGKSISHR